MVPASFTGRVSFGLFVLDGGTRELRRGQEPGYTIFICCPPLSNNAHVQYPRQRFTSASGPTPSSTKRTSPSWSRKSARPWVIRPGSRHSSWSLYGHGYAFSGEAVSVGASSAGPTTTAPTCWLVSKARHVSLHEGENIIGRDPAADVWLDARGISRRHARIVVAGALASVEDAGSKNGTWLKGRRIESAEALKDGDQLKFGSVPMTFRVWSDGGSTDTTGALSR